MDFDAVKALAHRLADAMWLSGSWAFVNAAAAAWWIFNGRVESLATPMIAVSCWLQILWRARQRARLPHPPPPSDPDAAFLDEAFDSLLHKVHRERDYVSFGKLVLSQSKFRLRTDEALDIGASALRRSARTSWSDPRNTRNRKKQELLIPVIFATKGTLISELVVKTADGAALPVLPYPVAAEICCETWRILVRSLARREGLQIAPLDAEYQKALAHGMRILLAPVPRPSRRNSSTIDAFIQGKVNDWRIANPDVAKADDARKVKLQSFLRVFAAKYLIVAPVRVEADTFVIGYEFTDQSDLPITESDGSFYGRAKRGGRRLLRAGSPSLDIDVTAIKSCKSYHLNVSVPDGNMVASGTLHYHDGEIVKRPRTGQVTFAEPYFNRSPLGRQRWHFYTRGFRPDVNQYLLRVRIHEPPSETLMFASIYAVATLVCGWMITYGSSNTSGTDSIATLVGVPAAVIAAYYAFQPRSRAGRVSTSAVGIGASYLCTAFLAAISTLRLDRNEGWFHSILPPFSSWRLLESRLLATTDQGAAKFLLQMQFLLVFLLLCTLVTRWRAWRRRFSAA